MVGLEPHLREMESMLELDYVGVKMVAITGPAGIGKTTIARALHSRLSGRFQLNCFVDNLRETYLGHDEHGLKFRLQKQLLSKILNHDGVQICHSGVLKERLGDLSVLIVLDDVNNIKQLEALAGDISWFGPSSRIVVTTENQELLQQHGINDIYHVGFPSDEEALKILCRYAFKQSYPHNDYEMLAKRVTHLCGKLPLGLRVVGSSLRGKNEEEWEYVIHRLGTILDNDIEKVLRVGYESLNENEQTLFLHIVIFFNCKNGDLLKAMLVGTTLDVEHGLKILVNRSLIYVSTKGEIVIHKLLQLVGTKAVERGEPRKHRILIVSSEIRDVLESATAEGSGRVSGISLDISDIDEIFIDDNAFKRMSNLRFLKIYKSKWYRNDVVHIPEKMVLPRRLRLLDWEAYPNKCLPPTFHLEYLVELDLKHSQLEYLWKGTQNLINLKKMDLSESFHLKELPDLSNAINLEKLELSYCKSLVEIPSSFSHLQKLKVLKMINCSSLEVVPAHMNLASLEYVNMKGCPLENIPVHSTGIRELYMSRAAVEEVPGSISLCSRLGILEIRSCGNLKVLTHLPTSLRQLDLSDSDIEWIPDCIKDLHQLSRLKLNGCKRLVSLPEFPRSLEYLEVDDCESLENVFYRLSSSLANLNFTNCSKLDQQARKSIIQRRLPTTGSTLLPGRRVPEEFDYRARGNSLTISLHGNQYPKVRLCVVLSSNHQTTELIEGLKYLVYRYTFNDDLDHLHSGDRTIIVAASRWRTDHLFIFEHGLHGDCREIQFEFSSENHGFDVIECGGHISTSDRGRWYEHLGFVLKPSEPSEDDTETCDHTNGVICVAEDYRGEKRINCWRWIFLYTFFFFVIFLVAIITIL